VTVVAHPNRSTRQVLLSALLGIVVATVGTGIHRVSPPWGIALAMIIVLSTAVMVRAWARAPGVIALGVAVALTVVTMSRLGPGGDVLVTTEAVGYAWLGSIMAVAAVAVLPRRWFSDDPIERRSDRVGAAP
jgi:hypothetical protein